ncbi:hypothetical protein [Enterobacillus tribolii]|uniref:Uncharacterized protein n=1 Tax=Enterobacillus tribolii TaxID=1487935 RepID=A0A370QNS9_9GAMM|nr:hypothetical protein [Enterobacillus tribolii]MBW7982022.1 hypothetical protein [Enterobacillus tribolii]RDK89958.1 hypothetical protein C8D90_106164 [Enterobacillus tribolii]
MNESSEHVTITGYLTFNGDGRTPDIIGQTCSGLVVCQYYEGTILADPANVVYFQFGDYWYSICFEAAMVFWRHKTQIGSSVNSTLLHGTIFNDLSELEGVAGHQLVTIDYNSTPEGNVNVKFLFDSDTIFSLDYDSSTDSTKISADSPSRRG